MSYAEFGAIDIQDSPDQAVYATAVETRHQQEENVFSVGLKKKEPRI